MVTPKVPDTPEPVHLHEEDKFMSLPWELPTHFPSLFISLLEVPLLFHVRLSLGEHETHCQLEILIDNDNLAL